MNFRTKLQSIILLFSIVLMTYNCGKVDTSNYYISPFSISLNDPDFIDLQTSGNYVCVTGGYYNNGIIIYRSGDTFKAYDRTCRYNEEDLCQVGKSSGGSTPVVTCECCDSEYELVFGSITQGPTTLPLIEYSVSQNGDYLYISR